MRLLKQSLWYINTELASNSALYDGGVNHCSVKKTGLSLSLTISLHNLSACDPGVEAHACSKKPDTSCFLAAAWQAK